MSGVKLTRITPEILQFIAENMREEDKTEVILSGAKDPMDALETVVRHSHFTLAVIADVPLTVLGLRKMDIMQGVGVPWLLSAEQALQHKREFLLQSPPVIEEMLNICPTLINYVHAENRLSIRWLKWLGFEIGDPEPIGLNGAEFCRFMKER